MPEISIVIVNYNVRDLVLACLESLYRFLPPTLEIETIVVDNNSADQSVEAIRSRFPQVILINNDFNAGFPAANNQAFRIAKGKYIFMLNPDTEFIDDSLVKLYDFLENHPEISLVAPQLRNTDGSYQRSVWRFPRARDVFFEMYYLSALLGHKNYEDKNLDTSFEAESVSGAAIFFRRELFETVGMLDETMFWIEDIEFCYRAHQQGLKLVYLPEAKIKHHIGQSAKKNYKISLSNQIFNKIKFFRAHHKGFRSFLVTVMSFFHVIMKLVIFGLLSPLNVIYRRKAIAYAYTLPKVFNPPAGIK